MRYLLDTNVVSELRQRTPDRTVAAWRNGVSSIDLAISVLVVGEIQKGIEILRRRADARAHELEAWLDGLRANFSSRVLPVTSGVADTCGRLSALRTIPIVDGLLLATASVHGLTFVSREAERYTDLGVKVLNPWASAY